MQKQKGFTLIELVIVIVVLGILAAVVVPKYITLKDDALSAAKAGMSGAVKSALAIAIATKKDFPTVDELAGSVTGENVTAVGDGIQVKIDGTTYTVPTYPTTTCKGDKTGATSDTVKCVGSIP